MSSPIRRTLPLTVRNNISGTTTTYEFPPIFSFLFFLVWSVVPAILLLAFFERIHLDIFTLLEPPRQLKLMRGIFMMWVVGEVYLLYYVFTKEILVLSKGQLVLGKSLFGILFRKRRYELDAITRVRLNPDYASQQGTFLFEYQGRTIGYGKDLKWKSAKEFFQAWDDLTIFHCHSVESIMFGSSSLKAEDSYTTLHNPDVSTLTFPFVHLKHLIIETETYDFHQVERFITYAVNQMDHTYLKQEVEVTLYGNPEKLHPNLRNNLTNLCKNVYIDDEQKRSRTNKPL